MNTPDLEQNNDNAGGGEMAKLVHSMDWSKTPLGPIDKWPQSLLTTVSLCLASNFPISIAWGPQRVQIYNDGYWPICGDKHPHSMGQDYKECWFSAWPVIGEAFEQASAGQTRFLKNQRMFLDRYGYSEETFFTFSFSPILDESGGVGGLFHPVTELTQQTLAERRLNILRTLADHTVEAKTIKEASYQVIEALKKFELDLPFILLYTFNTDGTKAILAGGCELTGESAISEMEIDLEASPQKRWPLEKIYSSPQTIQMDDLEKHFGSFFCGPYPECPKSAMLLPVTLPGMEHPYGVLIAGVSSRRDLDEPYILFYDLLKATVGNAFTKAKAFEEERERAESLAELDRAKTVFFSNVSHELRTPLTLMLGPLEEVLNHDTSIQEKSKEQILTVHRNSLRLLKLVNTLLDFSRIEAGRTQAMFKLTDICSFTMDLSSAFRSAIEKAGIKFTVECSGDIDPVYVDHTMWERIVFNLLSNAYKFTFDGEITVSLKQIDQKVVLTVKDTGTGIPAEELPKLFSRFHRIENSRGRSHEGTGIGLAMVSELIKLHGGTVTVESETNRGSTFTITVYPGKEHLNKEQITDSISETRITLNALPNVDEELGHFTNLGDVLSYNDSNALLENQKKDKVLVVDDNADMRAYMVRLLQDRYEVTAVNDGLEALGVVEKEQPNLILSDIMMPNLDGLGLLKQLRSTERTSTIPVIFLSARAGEEAKVEGIEAGADDYLIKPFNAKELLARVKTNLIMSKIRKQAEEKIRESEERFRSLADQSPMIVFIIEPNAEATVSYFNKTWLDYTGQTFEQAIGRAWDGIVHSDDVQEVLDTYIPAFQKRQSYTIPSVRLKRFDGEYRWHLFRGNPRYLANGEFMGFVGVGTDIHDQKMVYEQLEVKNDQLVHMNNDLDNFIYTASHDLKSPINNIEGLIDVLNKTLKVENKGNPKVEALIGMIHTSIDRFKNTITDLTEVAKVQSDGEGDLSEISFKEMLEEAKLNIQDLIDKSSTCITYDFSKMPAIYFSKKNLRSILYNFVSNAIKYSSPDRKPNINLTTSRHDDRHILLKIQDNGLGMKEEDKPKIFVMFKRLHQHVEGTGIGLSIVKKIIDNNGGKIEIESEVGKGTLFKIYLKG